VASIAVPYEASVQTDTHVAADRGFRPASPVVFVVPAFNEAENIPRLLRDLERRPTLFPEHSRLIIVDDGSEDETVSILRAYGGPLPLEVVPMDANAGPGAAFRRGFEVALADSRAETYVVTLEADTTSDLDALPNMLAKAHAGADLVLASVHGGGRMLNVSIARRVLSAGASHLTRLMLGLDARTVSSFFRVYRADTLRRAVDHFGDDLIRERGFACKAELLAKLVQLGARVEEVPVDLDAALRNGESKMRVLPTLAGYWRLMTKRSELSKEPAA
jgi:dolichol-phosphate mannosyltransferase